MENRTHSSLHSSWIASKKLDPYFVAWNTQTESREDFYALPNYGDRVFVTRTKNRKVFLLSADGAQDLLCSAYRAYNFLCSACGARDFADQTTSREILYSNYESRSFFCYHIE